MRQGEILFLVHRVPYPPNRGDKIRSFHLLQALTKLAPVHIVTLGDDLDDCRHAQDLSPLVASCRVERRVKPLWRAGAEAVISGQPVSFRAFHHAGLCAYVQTLLADRPISAIVAFSSQMGQYIPGDYPGRVVFDFVDVDSAKFAAYAADASAPMRWVHRREERLLRAAEAALAERSAVSLLVSPEEAELFAQRLPQHLRGQCRVLGMRNGIDTIAFDPAAVEPEPALHGLPGPRLIFTGQMDYAPNIAATERAARAILPLVRARLPQASLHIVGRNPGAVVTALGRLPGVTVWGAVDDIRGWLAAADMALVPLAIARGIQNKVLEAMAMALPVIATRDAATGIPAQAGRDLIIADHDQQMADEIVRLAQNRSAAQELGQTARQFVVKEMSWTAALAPLAGLVLPDAVRDAA